MHLAAPAPWLSTVYGLAQSGAAEGCDLLIFGFNQLLPVFPQTFLA
jgi:hypothetical protein